MGYLHISNLYKDQTVLMFREVYALEKIHGTSAHLSFKTEMAALGLHRRFEKFSTLGYFSGGESYEKFKSLFNHDELFEKFKSLGHDSIMVYGEAYGGKCQGMSHTYGKNLKFVAFDVKVGDVWLNVENATDLCQKIGIDFVAWNKVPATVEALNAERDLPSRQAKKNGILEDKIAEGIIVRPLVELIRSNGERVIAKHKRPEFSERASKADTKVDPEKAKVLTEAKEIADEWTTDMRLEHVLDKLPRPIGIEQTPKVIAAMTEDILREGAGEFVDSKEVRQAIGKKTVELFKKRLSLK